MKDDELLNWATERVNSNFADTPGQPNMLKFYLAAGGVIVLLLGIISATTVTTGLVLAGMGGLVWLGINLTMALAAWDWKEFKTSIVRVMWALVDISVSLLFAVIGSFSAGKVIGGASGLLAGLIFSIFLKVCFGRKTHGYDSNKSTQP